MLSWLPLLSQNPRGAQSLHPRACLPGLSPSKVPGLHEGAVFFPPATKGQAASQNLDRLPRLTVGAGRGVMGYGSEGGLPNGSSTKAASGRPEVPSRAPGAEHVLFIPTEDAGGQKKYLDVRADLYFWKSYVSFSEEKRARPIS